MRVPIPVTTCLAALWAARDSGALGASWGGAVGGSLEEAGPLAAPVVGGNHMDSSAPMLDTDPVSLNTASPVLLESSPDVPDESPVVSPTWVEKGARIMLNHKGLFVALLLGALLLLRLLQLEMALPKHINFEAAMEELDKKVEILKKKKDELVETKEEDLKNMRESVEQMSGILERKKLNIDAEMKMLENEKALLNEKERRVDQGRPMLQSLEKKALEAQIALLQKATDEAKQRASGNVPDMQELDRDTADAFQKVEDELAVFDVSVFSVPREKERTAALREYHELVSMNAAMCVLTALPDAPESPEEAKDILRARRLLLVAVTKFQSTVLASINKLIEVKGQLQTEKAFVESSENVQENLEALAEAEWDVKVEEQRRISQAVKEVDKELEACKNRQTHIRDYIASHPGLGDEEMSDLELDLFNWESYEVTMRARRAQLKHSEGIGFSTKESFIANRVSRIQRAKDHANARMHGMPATAANLDSAIIAVSEQLMELQFYFRMARDVRAQFEVERPASIEPVDPNKKEQHRYSRIASLRPAMLETFYSDDDEEGGSEFDDEVVSNLHHDGPVEDSQDAKEENEDDKNRFETGVPPRPTQSPTSEQKGFEQETQPRAELKPAGSEERPVSPDPADGLANKKRIFTPRSIGHVTRQKKKNPLAAPLSHMSMVGDSTRARRRRFLSVTRKAYGVGGPLTGFVAPNTHFYKGWQFVPPESGSQTLGSITTFFKSLNNGPQTPFGQTPFGATRPRQPFMAPQPEKQFGATQAAFWKPQQHLESHTQSFGVPQLGEALPQAPAVFPEQQEKTEPVEMKVAGAGKDGGNAGSFVSMLPAQGGVGHIFSPGSIMGTPLFNPPFRGTDVYPKVASFAPMQEGMLSNSVSLMNRLPSDQKHSQTNTTAFTPVVPSGGAPLPIKGPQGTAGTEGASPSVEAERAKGSADSLLPPVQPASANGNAQTSPVAEQGDEEDTRPPVPPGTKGKLAPPDFKFSMSFGDGPNPFAKDSNK